ncbi:MAG: hypothetical protein LRZ88_12090 [Candidatus Cloacimonetes bacterium]|nr:hypothetical protein [Candidatus Cloacimonadota bacterium]
MSAVLKGMPSDQEVLKFPSHMLQAPDGDMVPVVIGQSMAKSSRLSEGDIFSIRVRDINGTLMP